MKTFKKFLRLKKIAAAAAAVFTVLSVLSHAASAIEPVYAVSSGYRGSEFYQRLTEVKKTGDLRADAVNVALSQAGYHEGDSVDEFAGTNRSGTGNFTEYNRFYGKLGDTYGYSWNATFVYWCMQNAGVPKEIYKASASASACRKSFETAGTYRENTGAYTPVTGDIVFFAESRIGIVVTSKDGYVYTVEGANNDEVSVRYYPVGDTAIAAYATPAYPSPAGQYDYLDVIRSVHPENAGTSVQTSPVSGDPSDSDSGDTPETGDNPGTQADTTEETVPGKDGPVKTRVGRGIFAAVLTLIIIFAAMAAASVGIYFYIGKKS